MNRVSLYVVRHIIKFLDGKDVVSCHDINRLFKNDIETNSIEYEYQMIKRSWQKSVEKKVLKEFGDRLDIERHKNGEYVFFIIDLDSDVADNITNLELLIHKRSQIFSRAGFKFGWDIDKAGKFSDAYNLKRKIGEIHIVNDITIVKPCRLYAREDFGIYCAPLYCWPYLATDPGDTEYFHIMNDMKIIVDFGKYIRENYSHRIEKHPLYFFDKIIRETRDCTGRGFNYFKNDDLFAYDNIDADWTIEVLEKNMKQLIDDGEVEYPIATELANTLDRD